MTRSGWSSAVVLGLIATALFWIDPIFVPLALLGPIIIGVIAARRRLPLLWPATVAVVAGVGAIVSDWAINHEDVAFHVLLTVVMFCLASLGWGIGTRVGRSAPA